MVKIKEVQYEKYNPDHKQDRIIEYSSWQEYIEDIQKIDGIRNMQYPSLPRYTQPLNFRVWNDSLTLEFDHRVIREMVVHEATLIEGLA
jgi:hypothetical protein